MNFSSRTSIFFLSLAALGTAFFISFVLVKTRPKIPATPKEAVARALKTAHYTKKSAPVHVTSYATVAAVGSFDMRSPIAARVVESCQLFEGKSIPAKEPICILDKKPLMIACGKAQEDLRQANLSLFSQEEELRATPERIIQAKIVLDAAKASLYARQEAYACEEALHQANIALAEKNHISQQELFTSQKSLSSYAIGVETAKDTLARAHDAKTVLDLRKSALEASCEQTRSSIRALELTIENLNDTIAKTVVSLDYPVVIQKIFAHEGQELSAGHPIATVRRVDEVELHVPIPDRYFPWLYSGNYKISTIDISLIVPHFEKGFSGAFLKGFSDSVNSQTRALYAIVGRKNPPQSLIDELKPGMYCRVTLELGSADDVFCLPREALQADGTLYAVAEKNEALVFNARLTPTVVFETPKELYVSFDSKSLETIHIISEPARGLMLETVVGSL